MGRLISDAAKLDDSIKENDLSFANIVKSIHAVQVEMDISGISFEEYTKLVNSGTMSQEEAFELMGTTAKEGATTIQGSLSQLEASWDNLVTGIADDNSDFETLINNMVESAETFFENLLPIIESALDGTVELIEGLFPKIIEKLPSWVEGILPNLVSSAMTIVETLINSITENRDTLAESLMNALISLTTHAAKNTPKLIGSVIDLILSLITELGKNLGTIIPELIVSIINVITEIATRAPELTDAIFAIVDGIVGLLTSPEGLAKMVAAGIELLIGLVSGIIGSIPKVIGGILSIIVNIAKTFKETDWGELGKNIVDGLTDGLKKAWKNLKKWFTDAWNNLVGGVKDLLGIHSPSRVFAGIGKNMALGVGVGWEDEFGDVKKDINGSMSFDDAAFGVSSYGTSSASGGGLFGGTSFGTVNINIDGANIQDDAILADMIAERLQMMTERRGAVFA